MTRDLSVIVSPLSNLDFRFSILTGGPLMGDPSTKIYLNHGDHGDPRRKDQETEARSQKPYSATDEHGWTQIIFAAETPVCVRARTGRRRTQRKTPEDSYNLVSLVLSLSKDSWIYSLFVIHNILSCNKIEAICKCVDLTPLFFTAMRPYKKGEKSVESVLIPDQVEDGVCGWKKEILEHKDTKKNLDSRLKIAGMITPLA